MSLRLKRAGGGVSWDGEDNWGRNEAGVSALFILVEVRIKKGACPPIQSQWHPGENCVVPSTDTIAAFDPCSSGSVPFRVSDDLLPGSPTQFEASQIRIAERRSTEMQ